MSFVRASRVFLVLTMVLMTFSGIVRAQSGQEKIVQERLERSGTLEYVPASKTFSADASFANHQASVRNFGFGGRTALGKSDNGSFRARAFNDGRSGYRAESFAVRQALAVNHQAVPQTQRAFSTRAVEIREDRAANRGLDTSRAYVNSEKPFLVAGKRQDTIDDLRKQKNLTIDQVREILNKSR